MEAWDLARIKRSGRVMDKVMFVFGYGYECM